MKNIKLRDCPFCGGNAIFETRSTMASYGNSGITFTVKCSKCGVEAPVQHVPEIKIKLWEDGQIQVVEDDRVYAANAWNGSIKKAGDKHDTTQ